MNPMQFHYSSNGDRWFLARDDLLEAMVLHQANAPAGGNVSRVTLADFLDGNPDAPERKALLRLIGSLVGDTPAADNDTMASEAKPFPQAEVDDNKASVADTR